MAVAVEEPPSFFSPAAVVQAFVLATGQPPPPTVVVEESPEGGASGPFAVSEGIDGQWVITLYPRAYLGTLDPRAMDPQMRGGLLCGTILHELQHKCTEQYGGGSGENGSDPNSCEHLAITYGTLRKLCGEMTSLFMEYRLGNEPDSDTEAIL